MLEIKNLKKRERYNKNKKTALKREERNRQRYNFIKKNIENDIPITVSDEKFFLKYGFKDKRLHKYCNDMVTNSIFYSSDFINNVNYVINKNNIVIYDKKINCSQKHNFCKCKLCKDVLFQFNPSDEKSDIVIDYAEDILDSLEDYFDDLSLSIKDKDIDRESVSSIYKNSVREKLSNYKRYINLHRDKIYGEKIQKLKNDMMSMPNDNEVIDLQQYMIDNLVNYSFIIDKNITKEMIMTINQVYIYSIKEYLDICVEISFLVGRLEKIIYFLRDNKYGIWNGMSISETNSWINNYKKNIMENKGKMKSYSYLKINYDVLKEKSKLFSKKDNFHDGKENYYSDSSSDSSIYGLKEASVKKECGCGDCDICFGLYDDDSFENNYAASDLEGYSDYDF